MRHSNGRPSPERWSAPGMRSRGWPGYRGSGRQRHRRRTGRSHGAQPGGGVARTTPLTPGGAAAAKPKASHGSASASPPPRLGRCASVRPRCCTAHHAGRSGAPPAELAPARGAAHRRASFAGEVVAGHAELPVGGVQKADHRCFPLLAPRPGLCCAASTRPRRYSRAVMSIRPNPWVGVTPAAGRHAGAGRWPAPAAVRGCGRPRTRRPCRRRSARRRWR